MRWANLRSGCIRSLVMTVFECRHRVGVLARRSTLDAQIHHFDRCCDPGRGLGKSAQSRRDLLSHPRGFGSLVQEG